MKSPEFIIIYDTYCGWCYGAAPMFDALVASGAEVQALHRHLFQGALASRMADGKGKHVLQADTQIAELTGQTFSQRYIDNVVLSDTEVLESKYTAQAAALVHARGINKEFALRARLEKARFIDGVSAADRDSVIEALKAEGVPTAEANLIGSPALAVRAEQNAQQALALMTQVGARGVPTILRMNADGPEVVNHPAFYGTPHEITDLVLTAIA